jgi:phage anti-repressor protein
MINQPNYQQIIQSALMVENIDNITLAKLAGFNEDEIKYTKIFWETTFNKSWLLVNKEMVIDWCGYTDGKNAVNNFIVRKLIEVYEENIDYKEVTSDHELVNLCQLYMGSKDSRGGHNQKYFIITGETLKCVLMSAQTEQGKIVRKYFIKVENLALLFGEIVKLKLLREKDDEIEDLEKDLEVAQNKSLKITNKIINIQKFQKDSYIYFATTRQYARNNQYRFGKTVKLDERLSTYQCGRTSSPDDQMYYVFYYHCENAAVLEYVIRNLLKSFKIDGKRDMFTIPFQLLKPYIENICNTYSNNLVLSTNELIEDNANFNSDSEEIPAVYYVEDEDEEDDDDSEDDSDHENEKMCNKCHEYKYMDEFPSAGPNKPRKNMCNDCRQNYRQNLKTQCIGCNKIYTNEYFKKHACYPPS